MSSSFENTVNADPAGIKYDAAMKKVMACIPIASQIVKETVPEFSDMSLDDIGKCFLSVDSACIGVDTDTTHTAVRQAIGLSTEDKTVSEGVVTYDVKLLVQNPKTQEKSVLIINLEAQNISNAKRLGYDLVKRAVYYASRLISSQKGELFFKSDYDKIRKIYSIWLVESPDPGERNSIVSLKWTEDVHKGPVEIFNDRYDLQRIVFVYLGSDDCPPRLKTIDVLNTLIDTDASSEEKLIKLEKMGISITDDLREEVSEMCNFSEGVAYKAREKGRAEGLAEGRAEGRAEGQNQLRSLLRLLKNEGREEDIEKVMDDAEFAAEMIEKYKDQI